VAFRNKMGYLVVINPTSPMHNKAHAAYVYARELQTLEKAEARELYYNYFLKDKGTRNEWLDSRLKRCNKLYAEGSSERVRKYMGVVRGELTEPLEA
tara:strand:+ start:741 stop:1031 length:291 start_codon:yes stop_codon:yes gene_type:complete